MVKVYHNTRGLFGHCNLVARKCGLSPHSLAMPVPLVHPKKDPLKKVRKKRVEKTFVCASFPRHLRKPVKERVYIRWKNILIEGKLQELQLIRTKLEI